MTGEHHVDDLIEQQQGEYRDAHTNHDEGWRMSIDQWRFSAAARIDQLERDLAAARAAAVTAFDGSAMIQQAHHERDHYANQIRQIREALEDSVHTCVALVEIRQILDHDD